MVKVKDIVVYEDGRYSVDGKMKGKQIVYNDPQQENILRGYAATFSIGASSVLETPVDTSALMMDIAQSHHFTIAVEGLSTYSTPEGNFSKFLPVKTMSLNYTSYENMSIPLAIFGDFPILNKKRVSTISLSCYDKDNNKLERELREWENSCFPKGRYVAYMGDITRELIYYGYDVTGKLTLGVRMLVIPSGNVSVSRDYSANEAKMINFSLVCVGDGATCATGKGNGIWWLDPGAGNRYGEGTYLDARVTGTNAPLETPI